MAPKVDGSWHLHTLSQNHCLDFFVLFSSAVSLLGSAGQGNHVAACGFQDALAHYRRELGLRAISINWGPWGEIGAAMQGTVTQRLHMKGFRSIAPETGLRMLEHVLRQAHEQVGVMSVDWAQYVGALPPRKRSTFFAKVVANDNGLSKAPRKVSAPVTLLAKVQNAPMNRLRSLLEAHIREQAIKVLGLNPSFKLDVNRGLATFGMDSLMTIELKNRLQASVGKPLSSTIVFDHPTVAALAEYLDKDLLSAASDSRPMQSGKIDDEQPENAPDLDRLSDAEAEVVLARELARSI